MASPVRPGFRTRRTGDSRSRSCRPGCSETTHLHVSRKDPFDRTIGGFQVVAGANFLARLMDGVIDLLQIDLRNDVEAIGWHGCWLSACGTRSGIGAMERRIPNLQVKASEP